VPATDPARGATVPRVAGVLGSLYDDHAGRYGWLLGLILAAIAIQLMLPGTTAGMLLVTALQAATVIAALRVVQTAPRPRHLLIAIAVAAVVIAVVVTLLDPYVTLGADLQRVTARATGLVLAAAVPVLIARDVAHHERISLQTVAAGLCVYLLLGFAFGFAHGLVDLTVPEAYTQPLGEDDAVYLSFITLSTVGFGDLIPVAGAARALTVIEAVLGQIYLVSIVALLVGNVGLSRRHGAPSDGSGQEATDA
jgi:hypothetical protein